MKTPARLTQFIVIALLVGPALSFTASAVPVVFNLRDLAFTAEIESGIITRSGIIATLTPLVQGRTGVLNQTGATGGFGVDVPNTPGEVSDNLDAGLGTESISIKFNVDVTWQSLQFSAFSSGEQAFLTIGSFPQLSLTDTGLTPDVYNFSTNNLVLAGQTVILQHGAGNGFSFDSFTVERTTAVPDAGSSLLLLCMSLGGLGIIARRSGS